MNNTSKIEYFIYDVEADNIIIMSCSQYFSSYIEYRTWSGWHVFNFDDNTNIFFNDKYLFMGVI